MKPLTISVRTAAAMLGIGTTHTWALIRDGKIEVIRWGRRTLVKVSSLEKLVGGDA